MTSRYTRADRDEARIAREYPVILEINIGQSRSVDWGALFKLVDCHAISYKTIRWHKPYFPYGVIRFKTEEDMFLAKMIL